MRGVCWITYWNIILPPGLGLGCQRHALASSIHVPFVIGQHARLILDMDRHDQHRPMYRHVNAYRSSEKGGKTGYTWLHAPIYFMTKMGDTRVARDRLLASHVRHVARNDQGWEDDNGYERVPSSDGQHEHVQ